MMILVLEILAYAQIKQYNDYDANLTSSYIGTYTYIEKKKL